MNRHTLLVTSLLLMLTSLASAADESKNCKIIERDGPPPASGSLATSVQAGNGTVSAQTTGGNGLMVRSGSGNGVMSSTVTTGSGGQSQMVATNSDGSCTIYRYRERKHD
jgi:hypothetical protein